MSPPLPIALDAGLEAAFRLPPVPDAGLWLFRRDGAPAHASAVKVVVRIQEEIREVAAIRVPPSSLPALLSTEAAGVSPSVGLFAQLVQFSRRLVERGSVRPMFGERAGWRAVPGQDERTALAAFAKRLPLVAMGLLPERTAESSWRVVRAFVDSAVDALIRAGRVSAAIGGESWEAEIERALVEGEGVLGRFSSGPRAQRSLAAFEDAARAREAPRCKVVLSLSPPAEGRTSFRLAYAIEGRDPGGGLIPPIAAGPLWSGAPEAHVLADELEPVRRQLQDVLQKAGQIVAPIEVSLASSAPEAALLAGAEAWALMTSHRTALEALGLRVVIAPALEGVEARFPRARVRLVRTDGGDPAEVSLAPKYAVRWEVVAEEAVVTPAELRAAARQAPLALLGGLWAPVTAEAGERLARVAERDVVEWTGSQALAAALAGEVRQPGDLADAQVIAEPGLLALIAELGREAQPIAVPAGLKATLREYQRRGLEFLAHRTRLGLGALLADDMGLGKTVQLISLLLHLEERAAPGGPTLLICPASLVGNWEREISRFGPGLKVVRHHGASRFKDSAELLARAGPHAIVLTTYGLVRRDAPMLGEVRWGTIVCDEAQNVKNPTAAQARAVRSIGALRRVALTGTPVENRLSELWSLLEFLNPGLLGPLDKFRREIALPIERERDARAARWLRAATAPFLIRRMKSDPTIAPELPDKEIIRVFCSLTEEQAKLYKQAVDVSLSAIEGAAGMERRGRVLKLLTSLKQICNHPAQFLGDDDLSGRSGKLERASEMLEEIVEGGERTLVFTQYVEMGERLCTHFGRLLGREIPFFHGSLTLPQRDAMVRDFQEKPDGPPVLVLSLKAGGVGLNLTRASHVLHYDRWWNPAVEDQATDRAHRIGQQRKVQVHHLVSMGTLEERIDRMLEDKRNLADAVITGGEAWLTELSTDDLRALVSLGSDAAIESVDAWDGAEGRA